LKEVDYECKMLALKMLGITVWLDGENVEVTGTLDPSIALTPSEGRQPLSNFLPLSVDGEEVQKGVRFKV
jgi:hypothetical protein